MMDHRIPDDGLATAGPALPGRRADEDRLDAVLAFVLAFGVLGAVWLYAAKPSPGLAISWPAASAPAAQAAAPAVASADAAPVAGDPSLPVARIEAAPATGAPMPVLVPELPVAAAKGAVDPAAVPVAPVPAVVVPAVPAAVTPPVPVATEPSAPAVAAVPPPVVAPDVAPAPAAPVAAVEPVVVIRENIRFAMNSAAIPASAQARLDEVARVLATDPRKLQISGHTDNTGKPGTNRVLSLKRAEAVRDYLVARGAAADRLEAVGLGPDRPVADNRTEAGRAQNRRIDITE